MLYMKNWFLEFIILLTKSFNFVGCIAECSSNLCDSDFEYVIFQNKTNMMEKHCHVLPTFKQIDFCSFVA